jgi:soluble lytic murein transglycosylase-like protein
VRVMTRVSAVLLVIAGCARAQQRLLAADTVRDLSRAWVRYYAEAYQVPSELVEAIIDQESAWNPYAVSRKGAAGLMQLMPKTAARFGVRNRFRMSRTSRAAWHTWPG